MKFNGTIIGIGILAGLASALMSSGVIVQGGAMAAMVMVLYFLTPLPIFIVALGWGRAQASLLPPPPRLPSALSPSRSQPS